MSESVDIVWLRDDFRLDDQPAIHAAAKQPTLFVYIHDESGGGARPLGGAAKWRLAESLTALEAELSARGGASRHHQRRRRGDDPGARRGGEGKPRPLEPPLRRRSAKRSTHASRKS